MGDDEYLRRGEADLANILLVINMDDMGAWAGSNSLAVYSASNALFDFVDDIQRHYPRGGACGSLAGEQPFHLFHARGTQPGFQRGGHPPPGAHPR